MARSGTARALEAPQLYTLLQGGGVGDEVAVTVPRSGRKHVLPSAAWGRVALDEVTLPWSGEDARKLSVVAWLRSVGASEPDLRRPAPPWPLLTGDGAHRAKVLAAWTDLEPWRRRTPWLEVALIATRNAASGSTEQA